MQSKINKKKNNPDVNLFNSFVKTKTEKNKRRVELTKRINGLYSLIDEWIMDTGYILKKKDVVIEDFKLPGADILSENNCILSFKPAGLWAFGVNCRIDISSKWEENILFDIAEQSNPPEWELVTMKPHKGTRKLTKMIFRNMLKRNNPKLRLVKTQN